MDKSTLTHGDIVAIGIMKNNRAIIIEYWDEVSGQDRPTNIIYLDDQDLRTLTMLISLKQSCHTQLPSAQCPTKRIISEWEMIKKLIAKENIHADAEIASLDKYFNEQLLREIQ